MVGGILNTSRNINKIMDNKKSITDVKISQTREDFNKDDSAEKEVSEKNISSYKVKNKKVWPIFLGGIVFVIVILLFFSFFLHSSDIKIKSKTENITFLNDVYTGEYNENETVDINEPTKSVGEIIITNNTKNTQTLREETRFQLGEGGEKIIYKIFKRVSIKAGKSVAARAYSDGVGEKYNLKKSDNILNIPGFKEAKKNLEYKNIFGKIKTDFVFTDTEIDTKNITKKPKTLGLTDYEVFTISSQAQEDVASIGVEDIFESSKGRIKISNKTKKNQRLRKETRFQNGDLIFKTYKSVTIPSKSSVVVDVYADESGKSYNLKKDTIFNIPGFKESKMDDEFEKITAVSVSDFSGGMIGRVNIPNKNEFDKAKDNLYKKSIDDLKNKLDNDSKKEEYIFLDSSADIENDFSVESNGDKNTVIIKSIKNIIAIKKIDFISMILKTEQTSEEDLKNVEINDFSGLSFKIVDENNFDIRSQKDILFSINGSAKISWVLDENSFIEMIRGESITDVEKELEKSFKNFKFSFSTSPFWRSTIPEDKSDIKITIEK